MKKQRLLKTACGARELGGEARAEKRRGQQMAKLEEEMGGVTRTG
jgi:hypothetical protein